MGLDCIIKIQANMSRPNFSPCLFFYFIVFLFFIYLFFVKKRRLNVPTRSLYKHIKHHPPPGTSPVYSLTLFTVNWLLFGLSSPYR